VRALVLAGVLSVASFAPLQCGRDQDSELRSYETPGEALYGLATEFKARGNTAAWRSTLEYLIHQYPSSRFATQAKVDLNPPRASEE
jgi:hypothetical protein